MKLKNINLLVGVFALSMALSCKDESLNPVPTPESGVRGWGHGTVTGSGDGDGFKASNFSMADASKPVEVMFRWISHDGAIQINKVEFYIFFNEVYKDKDGNFRTVRHLGSYGDGSGGRLIKTLEGGSLPANDVDTKFSISQTDVYELLKDLEFDYVGDPAVGKVNVFNNPERPLRTANNRFILEGNTTDAFLLSWKLYSSDGRVFETFGDGICAEELPLASCFVEWEVE